MSQILKFSFTSVTIVATPGVPFQSNIKQVESALMEALKQKYKNVARHKNNRSSWRVFTLPLAIPTLTIIFGIVCR
jgi:small-conductance mechanosensitive channel